MKPEPPKLWEVCFVIVGSLIIILVLTKMVKELGARPTPSIHNVR